jgi:hypothetical protein
LVLKVAFLENSGVKYQAGELILISKATLKHRV